VTDGQHRRAPASARRCTATVGTLLAASLAALLASGVPTAITAIADNRSAPYNPVTYD